MSDVLDELLAELDDLARAGKVRISFSANCVSGLIGDWCQCWRCRSRRGERYDEETEAWAARVSREETAKFRGYT